MKNDSMHRAPILPLAIPKQIGFTNQQSILETRPGIPIHIINSRTLNIFETGI